jgi:dolichol kinase
MTADYSQIEMRIMAHLSGDAGLIEAFSRGRTCTPSSPRGLRVPADEVDAELRRRIKAMSYGLAYGLSAFGLSKQLKISVDEAAARWRSTSPGSAGCATTCGRSSTRPGRPATPRRSWAAGATCPTSQRQPPAREMAERMR